MTRIKILFLAALMVTGTVSSAQEAVDAKQWLTATITDYFNVDTTSHFRDITTKRYAEYKQDAINLVYDTPNSLTEAQFNQKWGDVYDTSYAGIGESFLLGQQDHGVVVISKCHLTSQTNNKNFIFDTIISDTLFELTYSIEITVVQTKDGFKINDVKKRK